MRKLTTTACVLACVLSASAACGPPPAPTLEPEGRVAHYGSQFIDHLSVVQEAVGDLGRAGALSQADTLRLLQLLRPVGDASVRLADALGIIDTARSVDRITALADARATIETIKLDVAAFLDGVGTISAGSVTVALDLALHVLGSIEAALAQLEPVALKEAA